jgi:thiamine biosynthesis lipoprotein
MSPSSSVRRARPLLGSFVEITAIAENESAAHRGIDAAFAAVEEVQRRMSFHDPASTLSQLNRLAVQQSVTVDAWTYAVLEAAADLHRTSGGIFDVTIAPRLQALGFLPGESFAETGSFADVELLPENRVLFHRPLALDLGGIAKGFAVDRAVDVLYEMGISSGLVNAGGDLRAFGGEAFPIAIRHPADPAATLTSVSLRGCALATSAHYFADRLAPGATLGPIVDPRTGALAARIRSATVRASTALLADALTKVVMLAGEASLPLLETYSAAAIFVATGGEAVCSPAWHAAL